MTHHIDTPIEDAQLAGTDSVEIIASGYEWTCPNCEHFNHEIEVPKDEHVTCPSCHHTFEVSEYHHAMG